MKWDPAWADLEDSLSQRLDLLQPFHSATVGWIRQVEERPHYLEAMGELLDRIADEDLCWPEMIFAAASIDDEAGVKELFRYLSGNMQQIGRSAKPVIPEKNFGIETPKPYDSETARGRFLAAFEAADTTPTKFLKQRSECSKAIDSFFRRECGKADGTEKQILDRLLKAERRTRERKNGDK